MSTSSPTHEVDRDVVEAARLLSRAAVFSGVHASQLAELARHAVTRHLEAGDHLFRQGETGTSMYVLGRGRIRLYLGAASSGNASGDGYPGGGNGHDGAERRASLDRRIGRERRNGQEHLDGQRTV